MIRTGREKMAANRAASMSLSFRTTSPWNLSLAEKLSINSSPSSVTALDKVSAVTLEGEELTLGFSAKERFQGDVVLKDKDMLAARFAAILSRPVRIKLAFHEVKTEPVEVDQRVELLRKVFRGEIVKGEGHGDQSV